MYRLSECVLEGEGGDRGVGREGVEWEGVHSERVCAGGKGGGEGDRGVGIRGWGRGWEKMQGVLLARRL